MDDFERVVVLARSEDLVYPGKRDLDLAIEVAGRLAGHRPLVYVGPSVTTSPSPFKAKKTHLERVDSPDPIGWIGAGAKASDRLVFSGIAGADEGLERIDDLCEKKLLIAIAARGAPASTREERSTGLVVGRTLTESAT